MNLKHPLALVFTLLACAGADADSPGADNSWWWDPGWWEDGVLPVPENHPVETSWITALGSVHSGIIF